MTSARTCGKCGASLGSDTLAGLCPECMLLSALGPDPDTPQPVLEEELPETSPLPTSTVVSKFGDYELLEELAHGGMGVVYKARQVKLDRLVVVKMLLLGQRASDEVVERFKREAQAAAHLRHPNIVAIHEVGEVDGQPFFSMDYVPGKDLAKIVRERSLPAREAATYMRAVAEAIHLRPPAGHRPPGHQTIQHPGGLRDQRGAGDGLRPGQADGRRFGPDLERPGDGLPQPHGPGAGGRASSPSQPGQ